MITGKFFIPDIINTENSTTDIFRYTSVLIKDAETPSEKHPIYLVFKNHSIEFHYQGGLTTNETEDDPIFGQSSIVTIPIGEINYDETFEIIKAQFNRELKFHPSSEVEMIKKTELDYSGLKVFGLEQKAIKITLNVNKLYRIVILDFLDDFFNSNVFQQSPRYYSIKEAILNSHILKGVYLKADFYVKSELFKKKSKDELDKTRYFDALDKWTSFITTEDHKRLFATERTKSEPEAWFHFSDVELTTVLSKKTFNFKSNEHKRNIIKRTVNYLVQNYEIGKATLIALRSYFYLPIIAFLFITIGSACLIYQHLTNESFFKILYSRTTGFIISIIFGSSFFYLIAGKIRTLPIQNIELVRNKLKIDLVRNNLKNDWRKGWKLKIINSIFKLCNLYLLCISILLILSPIIYWIVQIHIETNYTILKNSRWTWLSLYILVSIGLGFSLVLFSMFQSYIVNLIIPRLLMAMTTAWIAILSSLDFWKSSFDVSVKDALFYAFFLIFFTSCFLLFEIRRNTNLSDKPKMVWKLLNVIIPAYILSLSIGLAGTSLLAKKFMTHTDFFDVKAVQSNIYEVKNYVNIKDQLVQKKDSLRKSLADTERELRHYLSLKEFMGSKELIDNIIKSGNDDKICISNQIEKIDRNIIENDIQLKPETIYNNLLENDDLKSYKLVDEKGQKSSQRVIYPFKIKIFKNEITIILIPGFLILMSAFALFSGIFLTLLFDDKPVTDPL